MDTYENENPVQPEQPQQPVQPEPQPQPGYYHGAGAGQKESPFAGSPYVTYYNYPPQGGYQQPWQQNYQQPWQQPYQAPQPPQPPKKKENKAGKIALRVVAFVVVIALILVGCGATALYVNHYWQQKNDTLKMYFEEKIGVLQKELEDYRDSAEGSVGELAKPGENLTASEIYQQNVNSVVAVSTDLGSGTGFVWMENGYIITNHHVIEGAATITVTMHSGESYKARLIGSDSTNDVALLKIEAAGLDPVVIGSSSAMQVGDQVVAIGNALGELTSSLTVGYVSGIDRNVSTDGSIISMIQIDAAINSGNSGGPLFNARGEVIGINTAKYSGTTTSGASIEGIGFAIPMNDVIGMLEDLRDYGYIRSAYLGVLVREMDPSVSSAYGLPMGVYVEDVTAGYCAQAAGVQAKDIIVGLGGYDVECLNDLSRALRQLEAGQTVTITVWRSGQELILTITLDEKPLS